MDRKEEEIMRISLKTYEMEELIRKVEKESLETLKMDQLIRKAQEDSLATAIDEERRRKSQQLLEDEKLALEMQSLEMQFDADFDLALSIQEGFNYHSVNSVPSIKSVFKEPQRKYVPSIPLKEDPFSSRNLVHDKPERIVKTLQSMFPSLDIKLTSIDRVPFISVNVMSTGHCGPFAIILALSIRSQGFNRNLAELCNNDFGSNSLIGFISEVMGQYKLPEFLQEINATDPTDDDDDLIVETRRFLLDLHNINSRAEYIGSLRQETLEIFADLLKIQLRILGRNDNGSYTSTSSFLTQREINIGHVDDGHYVALITLDEGEKLASGQDKNCVALYRTHNSEQAEIVKTQCFKK